MQLVFVYGSLMRGFHNHVLLRNARFAGPAETAAGEFALLDLGGFPGAVRRLDGMSIVGELYSVDADTLERLDRLESHPTFYRRESLRILTSNGDLVDAQVYLLARLEDPGTADVPDNDWRAYRAARAAAGDR